MTDQPPQQYSQLPALPLKVVVEVVTPEVVSRLEADNSLLRQENKELRDRLEALHRTVYRLMETVGDMKRQHTKK